MVVRVIVPIRSLLVEGGGRLKEAIEMSGSEREKALLVAARRLSEPTTGINKGSGQAAAVRSGKENRMSREVRTTGKYAQIDDQSWCISSFVEN